MYISNAEIWSWYFQFSHIFLQQILAGQHDDKPESAFYMVGNIGEVATKAAAIEASLKASKA